MDSTLETIAKWIEKTHGREVKMESLLYGVPGRRMCFVTLTEPADDGITESAVFGAPTVAEALEKAAREAKQW